MSAIAHIFTRRRELKQRFDVARQMTEIEETCIPSYLHPNLAAAAVAWARLFAAARLHRRFAPAGPVLDFGAASGELAYILPPGTAYDFVEMDEGMARSLTEYNPNAGRHSLEELKPGHYAAVFALDSLEHNDDVDSIVDQICPALGSKGVLILSGPTENALYRLGRRIAGFSGAYHKTTIYDIERKIAQRLRLVSRRTLPVGIPLFSVSCWCLK
ncbi:bifunctional 2-polyprenyl-6-hydroxyphenol methylase/3-demethylubiquinol 3-O-methyltransferase UbiG [Acidisphaera sp. S103]|uniref:class I SAM-dependent methyltransferase n=1 Tax=Acidisphaera sp. S103 TaxID=1747223 RepID=UPI00131B5829|nr:methyltransferase domain-containing protein [Acidisphaera sp. S103]